MSTQERVRFSISNPDRPKKKTLTTAEQLEKGRQRTAIEDHKERQRINSEAAEVWEWES